MRPTDEEFETDELAAQPADTGGDGERGHHPHNYLFVLVGEVGTMAAWVRGLLLPPGEMLLLPSSAGSGRLDQLSLPQGFRV